MGVQVNPNPATNAEKNIDPDDITAIMQSRAQNNKFGRGGFNSIAKIRQRSLSNAPKENNSAIVNNNSAVANVKTSEVKENPVTNLQPEKKSDKKIAISKEEK